MLKKLISFDSIGWLGNLNQFLFLYEDYLKNNTFQGVEIIPFKPKKRTFDLVKKLKNLKIDNIRFHGQTGGEKYLNFFNQLSMSFVNSTIVDVKDLVKDFSNFELLFHEPIFDKKDNLDLIIKNPPKILFIENHQPEEKGLDKIITLINFLRKNSVNVFGLIDIYHFTLNKTPDYIINHWQKNILRIKNYLLLKDNNGKQYFNAIHFPIGSRLTDSLPIELLTDEQLKFFAENILPFINFLTIENQQQYLGLIYPFNIKKIKQRNKKIFQKLKDNGIL